MMRFLGRPPSFPFARAATALASDVTLPPRRPSNTAARFLRGMGLHARLRFRQATESFMAECIMPKSDILIRQFVAHRLDGMTVSFAMRIDGDISAIGASIQCVCHALNIANRLGFVK